MTRRSTMVLVLILALVLLLGASVLFPVLRYSAYTDKTPVLGLPNPSIIGHRGAGGLAPENTLRGLREGMKYADVLEIDVHLSRDGQVVVMHDGRVDRTTNGMGEIIELPWDSIRTLDAGTWFGTAYAGEPVPLLSDVLEMVGGRAAVLIELKWPKEGVYEGLVSKVINIIRTSGAEQWVQLQSFEPAYLEEAMRLAPDIRCNQLLYGFLNYPPIYRDRRFHLGRPKLLKGINTVVMYYKFLSPGFVREMHALHIGVAAYTVNDAKDINKVLNLGVDAVISDYPDRVDSVIR